MIGRVAGFLTVALLLAGCWPAGGPEEPVTARHRITVDRISRTYLVHTPLHLPEKAPLVVMIHAGTSSGEAVSAAEAEKDYRWNGLAEDNYFIVAYPEGLNHSWNLGRAGDVRFLAAMVRSLIGTGAVDATRVYAVGVLRGGAMAYRLACDTNLLAAVGAAGGTVPDDCSSPTPVSVLQLYSGPGRPPSLAVWERAARCHPSRAVRAGSLTDRSAVCADGRVVELITIGGTTDPWPRTELDATAAFWQFFERRNVTLSGR
jgi:polyhydroxybutyrate depolymerase